jgi:hypothetical protein
VQLIQLLTCAATMLAADARFKNTGLERAAALAKDVQWFNTQYGVDVSEACSWQHT